MNKRILLIWLLLLASTVIFAACGDDAGNNDDDATPGDDDDDDDDDDNDDDNNDDNDNDNNDDDDDNDNDDDDDNDTLGILPDDDIPWDDLDVPTVTQERLTLIDGGNPGDNDVSMVLGAGGEYDIAANNSYKLFVYKLLGDVVEREVIAAYGMQPALAVDSDGDLHIAYFDSKSRDLVYGNNKSGSWGVKAIDSKDAVGWTPSLAVDENGRAHVAYCSLKPLLPFVCDDLRYATNESDVWVRRRIDESQFAGQTNDIALGPDGSVHIGYGVFSDPFAATQRRKYATNAKGRWSVETVDARDTGAFGSIAVGQNGVVHMAYNWKEPGGYFDLLTLVYARKGAGGWQKEKVQSSSGMCPDIQLDSSGSPRIASAFFSYYGFLGESLRYFERAQGEWSMTIVDNQSLGIDQVSLVLDRDDRPRIAYHEDYQSSLHVAQPGAKNWNVRTLEASGAAHNANFALDPDGNAHAAYVFSSTEGQYLVKHATNQTGQWVTETAFDGDDIYGGRPAVAVDAGGRTHVAFSNSNETAMYYASNASGAWTTDKLSAYEDGRVSDYPDIAVDSHGAAHVMYVIFPPDAGGDCFLRYAVGDGGVWSFEDILTGDPWGVWFSFALDAAGHAHVVYHSGADREFQYATNASGQWVFETIVADMGDAYAGALSDIVVDAAGVPHVVYYVDSLTGGALNFASRTLDGWVIETLLPRTVMSDPPPTLVVDSDGSFHVGYADLFTGRLHYLTNVDGDWTLTAINEFGPLGAHCAIDVADDGMVHAIFAAEYGLFHALIPRGYTP